ncbi:MAG TPA: metallophosphoesterase family protein [Anaeromyxobacteraceae bacterium]|nr:metallophosphoesterase family protein [Anaeromyxobacteraceae bacterium]
MRVLVVSDIHGNWEALRAVAEGERADRALCLGDIVDFEILILAEHLRPSHTAAARSPATARETTSWVISFMRRSMQ